MESRKINVLLSEEYLASVICKKYCELMVTVTYHCDNYYINKCNINKRGRRLIKIVRMFDEHKKLKKKKDSIRQSSYIFFLLLLLWINELEQLNRRFDNTHIQLEYAFHTFFCFCFCFVFVHFKIQEYNSRHQQQKTKSFFIFMSS